MTETKAGNGGAEITDRVALVTGGGRGLGRVIAQTLAAAGATVAVAARTPAELTEAVTTIEAAVAEIESERAAFAVPA